MWAASKLLLVSHLGSSCRPWPRLTLYVQRELPSGCYSESDDLGLGARSHMCDANHMASSIDSSLQRWEMALTIR